MCLTPGRRLEPTLEKLERCAGEINPLGSSAKALLALVQRKSNRSLEDFAIAIGASRDSEDKLRRNVDLLLKLLTAELANSGEWKLIEMANRHELKFVFDQSLSCGHRYRTNRLANQYSDTIEFTVPLLNLTTSNLAITETELQREIDVYNRQTMQVECGSCETTVQLVCVMQVPHACDPDFLTLVCKPPVNIGARQLRFRFSQSCYAVKAVSHWQKERKVGAVSREKSDGSWWFHGVVKGQPADFQYTEAQRESGVHFQDAAVLFAVRLDPVEEESGEEVAEEERDEKENLEQMEVANDHLDAPTRNKGKAEHKNEMAMTNKNIEISIEAGGDQNDGQEQVESDDEATKVMIERAKVISRKVNWKCLDQQQMVDRGLDAARDLGLTCYAHATFIPMDGRCLWSAIARSRNPSLAGDDLATEADDLRTRAVGATIQWIDAISGSDLEVVQAVVAEERKEALTKEQIIDELAKYMRSTEHAGKMGDLLFQAASAFLNQPLIIIQLRKDGDYCLPVFPDSGVFNCREEIAHPAILVRQGDHYDELGLSEELREEAVALLQELKIRNRVVTLTGNREGESQRMIPIATSTPVKDVDREKPGPSRKKARHETNGRSLFDERDEHFQSSLPSSAGMERGNFCTKVQCTLLLHVFVCLFVILFMLVCLFALINRHFFGSCIS